MKLAFVNKKKLGSGKPSTNLGGGKSTTYRERVSKYRKLITNDKIKKSCKTN